MLLVDLGITRSHSRPHVSNDNPFSEAQFKTLNDVPDFPPPLRNRLAHARLPLHQHIHADIDEHRQQTLNRAWNEHLTQRHIAAVRLHALAEIDSQYLMFPS